MEHYETLGSYEPKGSLVLRNGTNVKNQDVYKVVDKYGKDGHKEQVVATFLKPLATVFPPGMESDFDG